MMTWLRSPGVLAVVLAAVRVGPAGAHVADAVAGANLAVGSELPLGPVSLGANLELVGLAIGAQWHQGSLQGEPQTVSLFRYGAADLGALNSEFYFLLGLSARLAARAGLSHYVTNYAVTNTAAAGGPTARYQRFETVPFAALRLRL